MEGDLQAAGGDEPAGGLCDPGHERGRAARAAALRLAGGRLPPPPGAADATGAGVPAHHRAGDEDAPVRDRRAILPRGSRCGWQGTAGPRLGGTAVAADDGGDPAAAAVHRARQSGVRPVLSLRRWRRVEVVAGLALLLAACGSLPPTGSLASIPSPCSATLLAGWGAVRVVVRKPVAG